MEWITVLLVVPFIIGMLGEVVKQLVLPGKMPEAGWTGWRGVYFVTYKAHALAIGALAGLLAAWVNIPWPKEVFGEGAGGGALAFCFSGGVAMVAYAGIVGVIKNLVKLVGARTGAAAGGGSRPTDPGGSEE
jgi:hypothetical protein